MITIAIERTKFGNKENFHIFASDMQVLSQREVSMALVHLSNRAQIEHSMNLDGSCAGCFTTTHEGFETLDQYIKSCNKCLLLVAVDGIG